MGHHARRSRSLRYYIGMGALVLGLGVVAPQAVAATATTADITDPDSYRCSQSGFVTFETLPDGTNLAPTAINGVQFTTTNGYTWLVGDFATGGYNGKYPNGAYTSQGTHWAWLGPNQGSGRIDFINGSTSYVSLLISGTLTPVQLDAYGSDGTLLATAGPAPANTGTGHMSELKVARDTADVAYIIVHDSGNYFLVDSICTNAPGVPRNTLDDFKQDKKADGTDVTWAKNRLYELPSCATMAAEGCAITAFTDVFSSYGMRTLPDGATTDPGTMNHYLGVKGGHSGCSLFWAPAARSLGYKLLINDPSSTALATRIKHIDDALAAGNLVIAGIGGHYVVFYEKAPQPAADGSPDYLIADPARYKPDHTGMTLSRAYPKKTIKQLDSILQVIVIENKAAKPGRAWAITAHSPVQMLITDPARARTGYDPATKGFMSEIEGSSYGVEQGLVDDTGELPPQEDVLSFGQSEMEEGTYRVDVIGTGVGHYRLDFAVSGGPDDNFLQSVEGEAITGQTDTYLVSMSNGKPIAVRRDVKVEIKPGADPAPISVGAKGVLPVAIMSSPTFDARAVDVKTLRFGPAGAAPLDKQPQPTDVNGDGFADLVVHFDNLRTGIPQGATQACLTGILAGGVTIFGCDQVVTVPPSQ